MKATASPQEFARFRLNEGDVVITKDSEDWQDIAVPALIEETADDFVCGYHLGIIRPTSLVDPGFVFRAMQSVAVNCQLQVAATGITRFGLPKPAVGEALIPFPPLDEQRAIADYLDTETSRIDTLISKKRRLIELLAEYRTALITHTVTRGLDPSPRLRPSSVDWLGDIPAHWELLRLGRMGSFFKGGGGTKQDETTEGVPCVRYGDLYTHHQFFIRDTRANIAETSTSNYRPLQYGDVLFAGSGETIDEIGTSAVNLIKGRAFCGGDVIVFRSSVEIHANFLGYAADCQSSVYQKACMGRGVTVMHIYSSELKGLLIPVPSIAEQRAIADYLDTETTRIDALSSRTENAIKLLEEYRMALITAAVTGQVSVKA